MLEFSLREAVRELLKADPEADAREIAEKILAGLSPYQVESALREALPAYVRLMANEDRPRVARSPRSVSASPQSVFVRAVQEGALKNSRWYVHREWKFLKDFTQEDVTAVVSASARARDRAAAKHDGFTRLLALLHQRGVQVVGELSEAEIASALVGVEVSD